MSALETQLLVQKARAVDEGVAVDAAQARELGALQARDHAEDALLLAPGQLGLEADHVEQRAERIVLAQLDHRMRPPAGARIDQPDRLHGPKRSVSEPRSAIASIGRQPSK